MRPRSRRGRRPPPPPSGRDRLGRSGLLERDFVTALQALAIRPRGLRLPLLHAQVPALRARHGDRPVPGREIAVGIPQAPEEVAAFAGALLRQVAHAALRALHAERDGAGMLAGRIAGAGEELAVAAGLDHHGRAALLADLVGRPIGDLVPLERPGERALFGVADAGDERPEPAALHDQLAAARRAPLLVEAREVVHV